MAMAREGSYDLIILPLPEEAASDPLQDMDDRAKYVLRHAHCRVMLAVAQSIPQEIVDLRPS